MVSYVDAQVFHTEHILHTVHFCKTHVCSDIVICVCVLCAEFFPRVDHISLDVELRESIILTSCTYLAVSALLQ